MKILEQNQSKLALDKNLKGGFFLRKKPLGRCAPEYRYSDFAIAGILRMGWGSSFPTLGARTKTRQGWGTQRWVREVKAWPGVHFGILASALFLAAGCHSYHVETTVENQTGGAIQLLEVDYPSASFGADSLAAGEAFHYRIQLSGSGPVKVQFTGSDGRQSQITGPTLAERQEGRLEIVLHPGGKAEFRPQLTPQP